MHSQLFLGTVLFLSLTACSSFVTPETVEQSVPESATSVAPTTAMLDRDPCALWVGAYSWFDPEAPDGFGIAAPELFAQLCPNRLPFTNAKEDFCTAFRNGIAGTNEDFDVQKMIDLLCGDNLCEAIRKDLCLLFGSDGGAWLHDYGIEKQCINGKEDWTCE